MNLIESYFKVQKDLCERFSFENDGDYHIIDNIRDVWILTDEFVRFGDSEESMLFDEYYENNLNNNIKNTYRIDEYTGVLVTKDSGQICLMIFSNDKQITKKSS